MKNHATFTTTPFEYRILRGVVEVTSGGEVSQEVVLRDITLIQQRLAVVFTNTNEKGRLRRQLCYVGTVFPNLVLVVEIDKRLK